MIRFDKIHIERMLGEFSDQLIRAVFKIDVSTCTITEIIQLNRQSVLKFGFQNASPEKLIPNRIAAANCRKVIKAVHETGYPRAIRLPITLPTLNPENICSRIHFKKGLFNNTVIAISIEDSDFL